MGLITIIVLTMVMIGVMITMKTCDVHKDIDTKDDFADNPANRKLYLY